MIVLGTPKREIQEEIQALAHADADVSDKGMASIHLDVQLMTVKIKLQPPLYCKGPTKLQAGVAMDLGLLAVEAGSRLGGDVNGEPSPDKPRRHHMPDVKYCENRKKYLF